MSDAVFTTTTEKRKVTLWKAPKPLTYIATLHAVEGPYGELHIIMGESDLALLRGRIDECDHQEEGTESVHRGDENERGWDRSLAEDVYG